jgi:hypothetical protein
MSAVDQTTIGHSATDKVILYGGLPLAGLALGYFLPRIADWAVKQTWVPMQGPLELIAKWDGWWVVAICTVLGVVAGVFLAAVAFDETLKVTVSNTEVEFLKNSKTTHVLRSQVALAFLDGKDIVLQDSRSAELARERHDEFKGDAQKKIPAAFRTHGYPWSDHGDPHADKFRRWVEDDPELSPAANAVLRARSKAFTQGDKGKADLRELRQEVAKLGVVVRDQDKKQYWRAVP